MGNINQVLIATCTNEYEDVAAAQLLDRALLYNRDKKDLDIVLARKAVPLTGVDSKNIIKDENNLISLKDDIIVDSVTTRADRNGVDWKSQSKVCETGENKNVLLFFKQDKEKTYQSLIGGEFLEVGNGIYGHYQASLTSTGSRLLKGATTYEKKAKFVLAKYNDEWYYGIKFMSGVPASIYFAGWQDIDDSIKAPANEEYGDSDLSEVVELDDDSDTGTQVIEYDDINYEDKTWEFDTPLVTRYTSTVSASFNRTQTVTNRDGHSYIQYNSNIRFYTDYTSNYAQHPEWRSILAYGYNATPWRIVVTEDDATITLRAKNWDNNRSSNIMLWGSDENGEPKYENLFQGVIAAGAENATVTFEHVDKGIWWVRQEDRNGSGIEYYQVSLTQGTATSVAGWHNGGDNSNYNFGNGLKLLTSQNTSWLEKSVPDNVGVLRIENSTSTNDPLMSVDILGKCIVKVGFTTDSTTSSATLRITESLNKNSEEWSNSSVSTSASTRILVEATYNFNGKISEDKTLYFLNEDGPIKLYYVIVDYPETNAEDIINGITDELKETGEDGSPHIIRLNGLITKELILSIADQIRNDSNKQFIIDLSRGTMEAGATDWTADADLTAAFMYCVGLRAFYYPKNVTTSGSQTFMHCSFLREVHFNKEMIWLGETQWHSEYFGLFAGCRLKTIFLPANIQGFRGYTLSESNIINVYIEDRSSIPTSISSNNAWCEWFKVKKGLKFIVGPTDYRRFSTTNATFGYYAYPNGSGDYKPSDADKFINANEYIRNHVELWENYNELEDPEFSINYTE